MADVNLCIALPSHAGGCLAARQFTLAQKRHPQWNLSFFEVQFSALTLNFNQAWCWMLNHRQAGRFTHFLMVHDDIRPVHDDWLGVLVSEMDRVKADVLSVIVPLKTEGDLTSTALSTSDAWAPQRLTIAECQARPVTWTDPNGRLLFNTGLMLVKIADWCEDVCFTIHDRIVKRPDGQFEAQFFPEDWDFSDWCMRRDLKAYVTRAIGVEHVGSKAWRRA